MNLIYYVNKMIEIKLLYLLSHENKRRIQNLASDINIKIQKG